MFFSFFFSHVMGRSRPRSRPDLWPVPAKTRNEVPLSRIFRGRLDEVWTRKYNRNVTISLKNENRFSSHSPPPSPSPKKRVPGAVRSLSSVYRSEGHSACLQTGRRSLERPLDVSFHPRLFPANTAFSYFFRCCACSREV